MKKLAKFGTFIQYSKKLIPTNSIVMAPKFSLIKFQQFIYLSLNQKNIEIASLFSQKRKQKVPRVYETRINS